MLRQFAVSLVLCLALAACGGGGSGSSLPRVSTTPTTTTAPQSVALSITIPAANGASSVLRRPRYVSASTQSATVAVNGGTPVLVALAAGSSNCVPATGGGRTCTATVSAPVGSDTFTEILYANATGTGTPLSQNTTTASIVAGKANTVSLTLDGVVAKLVLSLANTAPAVGTATTIGLTVNVYDVGNNLIIGDPFVNPITLKDSDTSGVTSFSATATTTTLTLNSPADAANITISYNGKALSNAVFTASATGVTPATVTLTPQNQTSGSVVFNDYTTFGYDNQRDVFNPNSTAITPTSLPHLAWQASLGDFNTQSQPVLATEISGHAGVLFVGGGSGNVYAYDALTGTRLWSHNFGQELFTCGGSSTAYFGIGGSVAYDASSKSIYVVGNNNAQANAQANNVLYHLDAATGNTLNQVSFASPSTAVGPTDLNFSHTSITLNNGIAYVGTGSTCDISSWRGRVVAVSVPAMTVSNTFFTTWGQGGNYGGGGIWGWGGVSLDANGNVLTGVGNADNNLPGNISAPFVSAPTEYSGYAETLLELDPSVTNVIASHHPIAPSVIGGAASDLDVQGTPLVFQPTGCGTMAALQAKSGMLTIYDESQISSGYAAQYQMAPTTSDDAYLGDPAYSPATNLVYADVASSTSPSLFPPGLIAINPGCGHPSVAWHAGFGTDSSGSATPRSVPAASAGGVVFAGSVDGDGGDVWAVNASTGDLLNGAKPLLVTSGNIRMPATIDGNWIFILDNNGNLYGLTIDPNYPTIAPKYHARDSRQLRRWGPNTRG
jgi:hypothetical protein